MNVIVKRTIRVGSFLQPAVLCIVCALWAHTPAFGASESDEAPVLVHFRAAQKAIRDGNNDLAVKEYKTVLRLDPSLVQARINLGLAYHMLGQYDLAVAELSKATREQPKVLGANIILGLDYLKLGLPEKAIAPLKEALAIEPSNREARRNLAAAYMAEQDYLHAGNEFREAFYQESDKQEAWFGLGHDYLNLSTQLTARISIESREPSWQARLAGDFLGQRRLWNDAAREYRKALTLQPTELGLHTSLGYALLHAQRRNEAESEFLSELRMDSNNIEALLGLSVVHLFEGDAMGAQQNVSRVLEISPQFLDQMEDFPPLDLPPEGWRKLVPDLQKLSRPPATSFLLWAAYKALGEKDKADEKRKSFQSQTAALEGERVGAQQGHSGHKACESHDYAACVKWLQPRKNLSPADYFFLGESQFSLGQFEMAADALGAALAEQPKNAEALYWLVRTYNALADHCFTQLMARFPDSWRTHQLWAETYHLQQADKDAIQEYQTAIRLRPQDFELHRALGELYLASNSLEEARKELESASALNPGDARGLYLVGNWYIAERQPQQAIPYLERSLRFDPGLLEAHAALGKAYLRTSQAALAAPELEKATALDHYGDLHYLLYEAYRDLGKKDLAQTALAQSQELRQKSLAEDQAKIKRAEEK
jgi:tetratricopeptide (TPR) repeat protein